jgi:hypothetical protein
MEEMGNGAGASSGCGRGPGLGGTSTVILKTAYQQADPETILEVVPEVREVRVAKGGSPERAQQRAHPVGCRK